MAEIVNLRRARKQKARADKDQQAAENRAKFGRSKDQRKRDALVVDQERRHLDQVRLEQDE